MLSDHERSALEEIEQRIEADDPRLAAAMRRWLPDRARWVYNASIVIAATGAAVCMALGAFGAGLIAILLTGTLLFQRVRGFAPRSSSTPHDG